MTSYLKCAISFCSIASIAVFATSLSFANPTEMGTSTNVTQSMNAPVNELAERFVAELSNTVVKIIQSDASEDEKAQQLTEIFNNTVDINWMAKFAIARFWNHMNEEQKNSYLEAYRNYLVKTYVPRFKEYNNQSIKITGTKAIANEQYIVTIQLANGRGNDKAAINIGYRCKYENDEFKIRDITGEDFSMLATQRSEFSSIVNNGGVDRLIKMLADK